MPEELFVPTLKGKQNTQPQETAQQPAGSFFGQTYTSHSYYRSKLFTQNIAPNSLIAAATPLLCLLTRMHLVQFSDFNRLHQQLVHEINAFVSLIESCGYQYEVLLISRYVLCVTFDEWIYRNAPDTSHDWHKLNLVSTLQSAPMQISTELSLTNIQNLIRLVDYLMQQPQEHHDCLELFYLCLVGGFPEDEILGNSATDTTPISAKQLKQQIAKALKLDTTPPILLNDIESVTLLTQVKNNTHILKSWFTYVFAGTFAALTTLYFFLNYLVQILAQPLANQLATLS